jgi:triacylglycerol lipase
MQLSDYRLKLADFDSEAAAYSARNALFLGEASEAAYADPAGMKAWAAMTGFDDCVPFEGLAGDVVKGNIDGFVATAANVVLVSFRGTDPTVADWMLDFRAAHVPDPSVPGEMHRGFHEGLAAVWSQIRPHLDARGNRRVWLTGHSLGGALAVACAARATFEAPRIGIRGIYTFGQPRYGDETCSTACAQLLASVLFRHINNRDIVPRVPLFFFMDYRHWGTEILFDQGGAPHVNTTAVETVGSLWWRILSDPLNLGPWKSLLTVGGEEAALRDLKSQTFQVATDHLMASAYLPVLRAAAGVKQ